jgi:hypothetical protein
MFQFSCKFCKKIFSQRVSSGDFEISQKRKYVLINSKIPPLALGYLLLFFPWFICSLLSRNLSCVTGIQKYITLETLILPPSSCPCQSSCAFSFLEETMLIGDHVIGDLHHLLSFLPLAEI